MALRPLYISEQEATLLLAALIEYQQENHQLLNAWTIGPNVAEDVEPLATTVCLWGEVDALQKKVQQLIP